MTEDAPHGAAYRLSIPGVEGAEEITGLKSALKKGRENFKNASRELDALKDTESRAVDADEFAGDCRISPDYQSTNEGYIPFIFCSH